MGGGERYQGFLLYSCLNNLPFNVPFTEAERPREEEVEAGRET